MAWVTEAPQDGENSLGGKHFYIRLRTSNINGSSGNFLIQREGGERGSSGPSAVFFWFFSLADSDSRFLSSRCKGDGAPPISGLSVRLSTLSFKLEQATTAVASGTREGYRPLALLPFAVERSEGGRKEKHRSVLRSI